MRLRPINIYVGLLAVTAATIIAQVDWTAIAGIPQPHFRALVVLTLIGVISEWLAVSVTVGRSSGGSSITFLPLLACVLLFGPDPTIFFWAVTGLIAEFFLKKKGTLRAAFNASQYIISAAVGGWAFSAAGGSALIDLLGTDPAANWASQLPPLVAFGVTFLLVNHAAVSLAIALSDGSSFAGIWAILVGRSGTNVFYDLLLSPLGVALAALYLAIGIAGFLVILLPLTFIRHAYATNTRLQQANRDLLRVLIKAIETRDPYTSGHSLRVQALAGSIARAIGLTSKRLEAVETAALLHDIGKIDVIYADILKKDGSLSQQERQVIESHVLKGVDLLTSLTSFPDEIIASVKHHHEWYDGSGYPEGISGERIPLGARIIMISDSVDAMLSDRPYRRALSLDAVHEQLRIYSGRQFDPALVEAVIAREVIGRHVGVFGPTASRSRGRAAKPEGDEGVAARSESQKLLKFSEPGVKAQLGG